MKTVVLDTSALIRLYIPDGPLPNGLEGVIESCLNGETAALVPELALVEAAQVILKKERAALITSAEADEILAALLELPLERVRHFDLLLLAYECAINLNITAYDAIFLALAKSRNAALITADEALAKAAREVLPKG